MLRASSVHKICTNRPTFDEESCKLAIQELKEKTEKKKIVFDLSQLSILQETNGLKTISNTVAKYLQSKLNYQEDPLPAGAKSYLQTLWLEQNGFNSFSLLEQSFPLQKGDICEDQAIKALSELFGANYTKNTERITKGFLSGEADIVTDLAVVDTKVPENWESFRKKEGIPSEYYWQLIAYCYLYNKFSASLCYVLLPTPQELIEYYTNKMTANEINKFAKTEEIIKNLDNEDRIKLYHIDSDIPNDIEFLISRVEKAEAYYSSLNYKKCMKFETL